MSTTLPKSFKISFKKLYKTNSQKTQKSTHYIRNALIFFGVLFGLTAIINIPFVLASDLEQESIESAEVELPKKPSIPATSLPAIFTIKNDLGNFTPYHRVAIKHGDQISIVNTESLLVKDIVEENLVGVSLSTDLIQPSADQTVKPFDIITVTSVSYKVEIKTEEIPFDTVTTNTAALNKGEQRVSQAGQNGTKELRYKITYNNDAIVSEELISEVILSPAINQIIEVGTRVAQPVITTDAGSCVSWSAAIDQTATSQYEKEWMTFVIMCESGCNAHRNSSNGFYRGILQFNSQTFAAYGGTDIYDGHQQIAIAHTIYASGGIASAKHHWPGCTQKFLSQYN